MDHDQKMRQAQRAEGPAMILAIGTANPTNCVRQDDFPDFYFRVTNSEHMTKLKDKFKRICERTTIKQRYLLNITEETLKENPNICTHMAPSLDARQGMVVMEIPKLGEQAALKALKEWGQPKSMITHLVFVTTSGVDVPGADYHLTKILGLSSSVNRHMVYLQGCFAGATALRLAKDLAENNRSARVLVVCSEIITIGFRGPNEDHLDTLVAQALFGDGAAAAVVGADPDEPTERPLFRLVSAGQTILPDSEEVMALHIKEVGLTATMTKDVPTVIAANLESCLAQAFNPIIGDIPIGGWNSIFWVAHPGGPAILDQVETKLGLSTKKLSISRHVLSEYGNMMSCTVLFILDEMRKTSLKEGKATTGEGFEWGILLGFGPGITVETIVLQSVPLISNNSG